VKNHRRPQRQRAAQKRRHPLTRQDLLAQHHAFRSIRIVGGVAAKPGKQRIRSVAALPLIVRKPQWVRFEDRYFPLREDGLYRFWNWGRARWSGPGARPEIIDPSRSYSSVIHFRADVLAFLSALATVHVHGTRHHGLTLREQLAHAKQGALSLTCGNISELAGTLLRRFGWRARVVGSMRVAGEYDTHDCGHRLLEFYWPKMRKWVLADVDLRQMFVRDGRYLNLGEVTRLVRGGDAFRLQPLTRTGVGCVDSSDAVEGTFPGYSQFEHGFVHRPTMLRWYRLGFAVPLMFIALAVPSIADRAALVAAAVAFSVTIIARDAPMNTGLLIGAGAGIAFGLLASGRGRSVTDEALAGSMAEHGDPGASPLEQGHDDG